MHSAINPINEIHGFTNNILGVGHYKSEFCTYLLIVMAILITFQKYNEDYKQAYFAGTGARSILDAVCFCVSVFVFKLSLDRQSVPSICRATCGYRIF